MVARDYGHYANFYLLMTKEELQILHTLAADFKNHSEFMINSVAAIHAKIDAGQAKDDQNYKALHDAIYDNDEGLNIRVKSLEKTRQKAEKNIQRGLAWLLSLIGSGIVSIILYFKGKLASLLNLLHI